MLILLRTFVILLHFPFGISTIKQSAEFSRVHADDDKLPTTAILSELTQVSSLFSCSALCRKRANCSSFFYNSGYKKCVCTGQINSKTLQTIPGYIHFSTSAISEWVVFEKSEYLFIKKWKTWLDAQIHCHSLGAKLAEIETEGENSFLKNIASQREAIMVSLGGTEAIIPNRWIWSTTFQAMSYTDWAPNKPDSDVNDYCMVLSRTFAYTWDDEYCHTSKDHFVCERVMI